MLALCGHFSPVFGTRPNSPHTFRIFMPLALTQCELCDREGWQVAQTEDAIPSCGWSAVEDAREARQWGRMLAQTLFPEAYPKPKPRSHQLGESIFERVKAAYRIEDVAHRLTTLYGHRTLSGKCPFHGEIKGRALVIFTDSQTWRCYGKCQDSGDVISLVRKAMESGLW